MSVRVIPIYRRKAGLSFRPDKDGSPLYTILACDRRMGAYRITDDNTLIFPRLGESSPLTPSGVVLAGRRRMFGLRVWADRPRFAPAFTEESPDSLSESPTSIDGEHFICNRCNRPRPMSVAICPVCQCPEFRIEGGIGKLPEAKKPRQRKVKVKVKS